MDEIIEWVAPVEPLRAPLLVVALEGFVDAGQVAATTATFLRGQWPVEAVARIDVEPLLDFRARRPWATVEDGEVVDVSWPTLEVAVGRTDGARDVALLTGPEPDARWATFCRAVADLAGDLGVDAALTLGAYPAAAPHTRPIRVRRVARGPGVQAAADLAPQARPVPAYAGPVGVQVAVEDELARRGVPAVGLYAEVPHYIAASPNPAAARALSEVVATAVGAPVDPGELDESARAHREQVDEAVAEHPEAGEMVARLEEAHDAGDDELPSGEDIAHEIERFLRGQGD